MATTKAKAIARTEHGQMSPESPEKYQIFYEDHAIFTGPRAEAEEIFNCIVEAKLHESGATWLAYLESLGARVRLKLAGGVYRLCEQSTGQPVRVQGIVLPGTPRDDFDHRR
jgi:hypothetical protein